MITHCHKDNDLPVKMKGTIFNPSEIWSVFSSDWRQSADCVSLMTFEWCVKLGSVQGRERWGGRQDKGSGCCGGGGCFLPSRASRICLVCDQKARMVIIALLSTGPCSHSTEGWGLWGHALCAMCPYFSAARNKGHSVFVFNQNSVFLHFPFVSSQFVYFFKATLFVWKHLSPRSYCTWSIPGAI